MRERGCLTASSPLFIGYIRLTGMSHVTIKIYDMHTLLHINKEEMKGCKEDAISLSDSPINGNGFLRV